YPKLDLVEVSHPGWGAMENPGLITFTSTLLEDPHPDNVVAHELAHLWFGDTVTPAWWNDIWLNESFATYFAARLEGFSGSYDLDWWARRANSANNLIVPAATTQQLENHAFAPESEITHGAGVLAALDRWLGSDVFLHVLHEYLAAHVNGTVTTADLATALGSDAGAELRVMIDGGWPAISATLDCKRVVTTSSRSLAWPICVAYDRDGTRAEACGTTAESFKLPAHACPRWLLGNANARGMYTLQADEPTLDAVVEHGWKQLTLAEKIYVFDLQPTFMPSLDLLAKLDGDLDPRWLDREAAFLVMLERYVPSDLEAAFRKRVIDRFGVAARKVDLATNRNAGDHAVDLIARVGDAETEAHAAALVEHARELAKDWVDVTPILALAMRNNPALADRLFHELGPAIRDIFDNDLEESLAALPSILDVLARDPARTAKLPPYLLTLLLQRVCDVASRVRAVALVGDGPAVAQIDRCIATKQQLDPHFRAWLTH
ncbi:MAG TPA: M1 family aminopeptidase, partial [Kofleriaceae bacterium]